MPITVDEFWQTYPFQPYELIRGEIVKSDTLGFRYSIVGMRIEAKLIEFVERYRLGEVFGANNAYRLSRYTLRSPRVSYISRKKWNHITYPYSYLPFPPDIAIEVVTPDMNSHAIREMCAQYVRSGTHYVWVFQPELQQMTIYSRHDKPRTLTRNDYLKAPKWHPEFIVALDEIIPKPRRYN